MPESMEVDQHEGVSGNLECDIFKYLFTCRCKSSHDK